jgi:hypothetical protein
MTDPNSSKIAGLIRAASTRMGHLDAAATRWVYGPRSQIAATLRFGIPAGERLHAQVLITARGHLVLTKRGPRGELVTVSGTVLELVYDTTTWQLTDFGITRHAPNLARIGHVYAR